MSYLDKVKTQLANMSEFEKDAWILSQAKLLSEQRQTDFLLSLSGEKKIIDMLPLDEIVKFCQQVESGEVYFEYETHYYEFDDEGRYVDDWGVWYNDPFDIGSMMDNIMSGCRKLLCLEEYQKVFDILDKVFQLKFFIEEAENSEDIPEEEYLSLLNADKEGIFSESLSDAGMAWIKSYLNITDHQEDKKRAKKIIEMLEHPVFEDFDSKMLIEFGVSQEIFTWMSTILKDEIADSKDFMEKKLETLCFLEQCELQKALEQKEKLLLAICDECLMVTS